jgi:hypothetical protein
MPQIVHETPSKIVEVTLHPTGRMFLATEKTVYELGGDGVWNPMKFAVAEPVVVPADANAKPGLFAPTPAVHS